MQAWLVPDDSVQVGDIWLSPSGVKICTHKLYGGAPHWSDLGGGSLEAHAVTHQNGGDDEISVAGLSGVLADAQTPVAHGHPIADVANLQSSLDGKAAFSHSHAIADVTNLQSGLDGKEPTQTAVSQADAEAGTGTVVRSWTPQRVNQAIQALAPAGGGGELENIVRLGSDVVNSTTTLADVTGLSFAMEANKDYLVEAFLFQSAAATTTGIRQALNGPASSTRVAGEWTGWGANANAPLTRGFNTYEQVSTAATDTPATIGAVKLLALVRNGANAGNLQLRFASEVGGSAVTIFTGSVLRWRKLN